MAGKDHYHHNNHHIKKNTSSCCTSFIFFSLLLSASLILAFSLSKTSISLQESQYRGFESSRPETNRNTSSCDYSNGRWIYDPDSAASMRYDSTCKEIYKGWNCIAGNKSNALDILKWRWKPNDCDLPQFDPLLFLQHYRDTNIGFVGDSLNRNMFVSLFCTLKRVSGEVKKWRPAGADRAFTFLRYNLTIAYHRTNLLARYGRWTANANGGVLESLGYKVGYRIDVDIPDGNWADAPTFHDILIFNTGHW
jgi:hypothetical protein